MNRALQKLVYIYFIFMLVFVLMKPVFMTVYYSLIHAPASQWLAVVRHGWSMDGSVAGYLTVIPALLTVAQLITRRRWPTITTDIYMGIAALTVAALYTLDLGLYGSWGFRLDMTPVFYFTTSPSAAMASVEWWHWVCGIIGVAVIASMIWFAYRYTARRVVVAPLEGRWRVGGPVLMLLISALLVIPIRGSLTVATMNPSFACFSDNQRLNHAATNPLFNLLYSATHQAGFDRMYRFMSDDDARRITDAMLRDSSPAAAADSVTVAGFVDASGSITLSDGSPLTSAAQLVKAPRPDIVLIILESFSSHLMPSLGGADVASGLDSIGRDGVLFGNVFASSFRTDRALTAILSGFPATTNTSLLKFTGKFPNLPSMPAALKSAGYSNSYFYGGDANFTNMSAYLRSAGFGQLVSDKDFPLSQRASKWGAHDSHIHGGTDLVVTRAIRGAILQSALRRQSPRQRFRLYRLMSHRFCRLSAAAAIMESHFGGDRSRPLGMLASGSRPGRPSPHSVGAHRRRTGTAGAAHRQDGHADRPGRDHPRRGRRQLPSDLFTRHPRPCDPTGGCLHRTVDDRHRHSRRHAHLQSRRRDRD